MTLLSVIVIDFCDWACYSDQGVVTDGVQALLSPLTHCGLPTVIVRLSRSNQILYHLKGITGCDDNGCCRLLLLKQLWDGKQILFHLFMPVYTFQKGSVKV